MLVNFQRQFAADPPGAVLDGRDIGTVVFPDAPLKVYLDGSPREVSRAGSEVKCFFPEENLVIVEQRPSHRGFPSLLPIGLGSLPEHYTVRGGDVARVAGVPEVESVVGHAHVEGRELLRRERVHVAADRLDGVSDLSRCARVGALEQQVLEEVTRPGKLVRLVARPGAHPEAHRGDVRRRHRDDRRLERAQFVAAPGLSQPRKSGADEAFEIRYRVIWPE